MTVWTVSVQVDASWFDLHGALADRPFPVGDDQLSEQFAVHERITLVGREVAVGPAPHIAIVGDTGVSRRHAQLVVDDDMLTVVDLSSTNGTYHVAAGASPEAATTPLIAGVPLQVSDGDSVYLGAWTRLVIGTHADDSGNPHDSWPPEP